MFQPLFTLRSWWSLEPQQYQLCDRSVPSQFHSKVWYHDYKHRTNHQALIKINRYIYYIFTILIFFLSCVNIKLEISHFAYGIKQINGKSLVSLVASAVWTLDHNIRWLLYRDHHKGRHLLAKYIQTVIHLHPQPTLWVPWAYPLCFSKSEFDIRILAWSDI